MKMTLCTKMTQSFDCPFSGSLGLWENILAGELDRCSSTREEVMVLDVHSFLIHGDLNNTTALIQQGLFWCLIFFVLLYCNTQSYCIRERFLYHFHMPGDKCLDINKKTSITPLLFGRSHALQTKQLGPETTLRPRSHKTISANRKNCDQGRHCDQKLRLSNCCGDVSPRRSVVVD